MNWALCAAMALSFGQGEAAKAPPAANKLDAPPAKAEAPGSAKMGDVPAAAPGADPARPPQGGFLDSMFPMLLLIGAAYLLFFRPTQTAERKRQDLLAAVKKDDRVVTSGGIIGVVANVEGDVVTLKVDESTNVRIKVRKAAVVEVLKNA